MGCDDSYIILSFPVFYINNILVGGLRGDLRGEVHIIDKKNKLVGTYTYGPNKISKGTEKVKIMDAVVGTISQLEDEADFPVLKDGPLAARGKKAGKAKSPDAPAKSLSSKFSSFFSSKSKGSRRGSARGSRSARSKGTQLSTISGSWVSHLDFDGVRYWTLSTDGSVTPKNTKISANTPITKMAYMSKDSIVPVDEEEVLPSDCRYRLDLYCMQQGDNEQAQKWKHDMEVLQREDAKLRVGGGGVDV